MPSIKLFVYGGSSSVGQYSIQLAKHSGYKVITTASIRNHELVKSLGADLVFDVSNSPKPSRFALELFENVRAQYNDPDAAKKIKEATNDSIQLVYDTISEDYTYPLILESIAGHKPAKISVLHKPDPKFVETRKDVIWLGECAIPSWSLRVAENRYAQKRSSIPHTGRQSIQRTMRRNVRSSPNSCGRSFPAWSAVVSNRT